MADYSLWTFKADENAENKIPVYQSKQNPTKRPALVEINGKRPTTNVRRKGVLKVSKDDKKQDKENVAWEGTSKCTTSFKIFEDVKDSASSNIQSTETKLPDRACTKIDTWLPVSFQVQIRQSSYDNCEQYRNDIYLYLRELQISFKPPHDYITRQKDITFNMRSILLDWIVEVVEEYKLSNETLHIAISLIDRFLSKMHVSREKLQLVGTACLYIATKYEEVVPPDLKEFVYITDSTYCKRQILRMEHLILKAVAFEITAPTSYTFLNIFSSMANAPYRVKYLAQFIMELSFLQEASAKYLPSEIGASSLVLANYTVGNDAWTEDIAAASGYGLNDLKETVNCLHVAYLSVHTLEHKAICDKYKSDRYLNVGNIRPPVSLCL